MKELKVSFRVIDSNGEVVHECYNFPLDVALSAFCFYAYMNYTVDISYAGGIE